MDWNTLSDEEQLKEIDQKSHEKPQLIFKHSTRCPISSVIKNRLYKSSYPENIDCYYLDLIANRTISNLIAEKYKVEHESPQVLLIKNGVCVFSETHSNIYMDEIIENSH